MKINCPHCSGEFKVTVVPAGRPLGPARSSASDISPLTDKTLADVWLFMSENPGKHVGRALYSEYLDWTQLPRPLTQNAFGRAVKANGGQPWRDSRSRGFVIPFIDLSLAQPAKMTPQQRERFEAAHQRVGVDQHRGPQVGDPVPGTTRSTYGSLDPAVRGSELPFEVEGL